MRVHRGCGCEAGLWGVWLEWGWAWVGMGAEVSELSVLWRAHHDGHVEVREARAAALLHVAEVEEEGEDARAAQGLMGERGGEYSVSTPWARSMPRGDGGKR